MLLASSLFAAFGLTIALASHHLQNNLTAPPKVTLDYGSFTGLANSSSGIIYYRGIRYADAPIGELRWRAPVSPPTLPLGDVDATQFANACIATKQTRITTGTSEDCLFGNVNVPVGTIAGDNLPVFVWFHGGGFQGGSTHDLPPDLIMQASSQPLIFVSFEYRLGQFGFLGGSQVREDGVLNAGLLDQRAALRWVQRYIHQFGGDKQRVTIWGQSAGAGSTMFHLIGNGGNDEGLFRAAMGDSPSLSFLPVYTDPYVEGIFEQFSSLAGCGGQSNSGKQMACLRSAASSNLTLSGSQTISARSATLFTFAPIIDQAFLHERPVEAFGKGLFSPVPVLFGSNTNEGANWSASLKDGSANTSMPNATESTVYNFLKGQYPYLTKASFNKALADFYPLSDYNNSFSLQGQQMYGETRYICTAALIAGSSSKRGLTAYQYHYDNPHLGSDHAAELAAFSPPPANADSNDETLFKGMQQYWSSFAAAGQPVETNQPMESWTAVSTPDGSPRLLLHPGNISMENVTPALGARCAFWHSIASEMHT